MEIDIKEYKSVVLATLRHGIRSRFIEDVGKEDI